MLVMCYCKHEINLMCDLQIQMFVFLFTKFFICYHVIKKNPTVYYFVLYILRLLA